MEKVKVNENEKVNGITIKNWRRFMELDSEMSPEVVCCDGEISRTAAKRRYQALLNRWHALEREVGRKVDEFELVKVEMSVGLF